MATGLSDSSARTPAVIGFVTKVYAIAANTFLEAVRQPAYAVIVASATALIITSPYLTLFTLNQGPDMMTDMGLATILLAGLLMAAFSASSVISEEIENKTVLTVISKPVGRGEFILGKFLGVAMALVVGCYLLTIALLVSLAGGSFESSVETDLSIGVALAVMACMVASVCYGAYCNFFHDRPFPSRAIGAALPLFTVVLLFFSFINPDGYQRVAPFSTISGQVVYACIMVFWSIVVLSSVAVAASTRLAVVVNLVVCSGVFLLGLLSEFLFTSDFSREYMAAKIMYRLVPNLQAFWVAQHVIAKVNVPFDHIIMTGLYAFFTVMAFLFLAMALFQERQVA